RTEALVDSADAGDDSFTVYGYGQYNDKTEQTSQTVDAGADDPGTVLSTTTYGYDLQGRMTSTVITTSAGTTSYGYPYDGAGNRISQSVTQGTITTLTNYVIDANNLTGYSQTLE